MRCSITLATIEQVRSAGGTDIKAALKTGLVFATLDKRGIDYLRSLGCMVSPVGKVKAAVMPPTPVAGAPTYSPEELIYATGLEDLRGMVVPALYGEGFNLAIIDTGIRETHEAIGGRVVYRKNYTPAPMHDNFNHGTGVCSIALATAPSCSILNMKVLDDLGEGTEEGVVLAIDDCIGLQDTQPDIAPSVINISLGVPDDGNPDNVLRVACRAAIENGLWVVAAAGNEGPSPGTIICPACEQYVGAVGSMKYDSPFIISGFSSRGPTQEGLVKPDAVMFGEDIVMASSKNDTATIAKSGTSFATPFYTGMAILFQEGWKRTIEFTGREMWSRTRELEGRTVVPTIETMLDVYFGQVSVKPEGAPPGKDNAYGNGVILGSLIAQAIQAVPVVGISSLITAVIVVGMLGMMMKSIK